jgi:hypothetical protein
VNSTKHITLPIFKNLTSVCGWPGIKLLELHATSTVFYWRSNTFVPVRKMLWFNPFTNTNYYGSRTLG